MLFLRLCKCILGGTTATVVLLATSISVGQPLNLPTTGEWIGGFVEGGMQAADALGGLRGRRLGQGIRRPLSTGRSRFGGRAMSNGITPSQAVSTYESGYSNVPSNPLPTNRALAERLVSTSAAPVWPRGIHIVNPAVNQASIGFVIDGRPYTLRPGQRLEIAAGGARAIQFDRGGDFGSGIYRLEPVVFTFTPTGHGWDLYQTAHMDPVVRSSATAIQIPPPIPWPGG